MGTAILLGIPVGYIGTARSVLSKNAAIDGAWSIKFVPAPHKEVEVFEKTVRQALDMAARYDDTHILGFSGQANRDYFADKIRPYFRFRWFDHSLLKYLGRPDPADFVRGISSNLAEESEWAARVKPKDLNSPLLLPECSFVPEGKHRELWRHASAHDTWDILGAEKAIDDFWKTHRRKVIIASFSAYKWVDQRDRIYAPDRLRHAVAPFPREWKYSYRIESGFHFDVTHVGGRQFDLTDASGSLNRVNAGEHLNVDPHGYVRS